MERIQFEVLLFNRYGLDRVNLIELIEDAGVYHIYENYGDRSSSDLTSSLVGSYASIIEAAARFEEFSAAMQLVGYYCPDNGDILHIPGIHSVFSEKEKTLPSPTDLSVEEKYRLLDV
jgi:hypothetical protein